ncbi:sigma factor-like helix-turn-helix DNA-binding protein [Streptomyces sp. NPDC007063]|uniref:sigma factor-like helix-turn-helix DNA-binding protein n=1 Tax=Streptomyces sp. NPDC007063 TaxID=3364772 RepID=UPI0036A88459
MEKRLPDAEPGAVETSQSSEPARAPKTAARAPGADAPAPETTQARPASDPAGEPAPEPGPEAGSSSATEQAPSEQKQPETPAARQAQGQAQAQAQPQPQPQPQGGDEGEPLTPTPRSEAQPQTGSPRVPAPAPRSEPEPRVEVPADVPGPVEDFVRSARRPTVLPDDPVAAFDELYRWQARALTRQALLLCGHRRVAERAVRWAFHQAWQHWPKVLAGGDPTRTVRATVYEYALSPWHRFHPGHRRPEVCRGSSVDSAVLESFLELPRSYRAALLLHYGLGLTLAETAAEAECSTEAAAGRIAHGRAALEESWPPLARKPRRQRGAVLARSLRELAAAQPVRPVPAQLVRGGSSRTTRLWTRASVGLTASVAAATAFTLLTTQSGDNAPAPERERVPRGTFAPATLPGGPETGAGAGTGPGTGPEGGRGTNAHSAPTSERNSAGSSVRAPAAGTGQAYLPQLRSTNTRVHLHDFP